MPCRTNIVCAKIWCATKNDLQDYLDLQQSMHYNTQVINMELYVDLGKSNLNTLISTQALSTRITLGIQLLGIHFDNVRRTGSRSLSRLLPMIMNAIGIPFYNSLNTIRVYKVDYKQHNTNISDNVVEHINYVGFHTIAKRVYLVLISAKCFIKRCYITMPNFLHNFQLPWSLDSQCEWSVILGLWIEAHRDMLNIIENRTWIFYNPHSNTDGGPSNVFAIVH
jgi:hypothetical protein